FEIDFGEGNVVKNISPATNTFGYYPPNGTYDVVLSLISDTGCKTSVNIPVEAFRVAASIDFDTLLCIGKADFFNAADTFGLELNYDWDFGNNTTSTNPTETVFYQTDGEYLITLSVADSNSGCSDEDMVTITIDNTLGIPNLFTPNGDDHNDFFDLIVNEECRDMVIPEMFKVYNRWGNLMYDNELPLEGWDGKLSNGDTAPAEIYTFVVKVDGVEKVFKGTVTLIK
ncbi:MAG: gliding motility-associated-like protein, partial [Halioglobus sp.]